MAATGIIVRSENGTWSRTGGTSASAPLWAGFSALINEVSQSARHEQVGLLNPAIYQAGKGAGAALVFHDITTVSNSTTADPDQFAAVSGYDLVTGWGTPRGQITINAIVKIADAPLSYCAGLPGIIAALQKQLAAAQTRLSDPLCDGPARFECVRAIQAIQRQQTMENQLRQKCH